jgi:hypothetical protein
MEVSAEVDVIPFFITNGKVIFMRTSDFLFNFGTALGVITAKLFKIKEHVMVLYQRMLIKMIICRIYYYNFQLNLSRLRQEVNDF